MWVGPLFEFHRTILMGYERRLKIQVKNYEDRWNTQNRWLYTEWVSDDFRRWGNWVSFDYMGEKNLYDTVRGRDVVWICKEN